MIKDVPAIAWYLLTAVFVFLVVVIIIAAFSISEIDETMEEYEKKEPK